MLIYLSQVATALSYIHEIGYLHNDIKGNNVILSKTQSGDVEAYLIDYGKACHQMKGKVYQLTSEECKQYEAKHPLILLEYFFWFWGLHAFDVKSLCTLCINTQCTGTVSSVHSSRCLPKAEDNEYNCTCHY